ncbi:major facilitator superfamily MFS_1 [[Leptolyngbya] sp. PCC 7376]|uniref:MFS transporter n=1 Tax=[Leptolyngbya] sp. PCC 7376 TaxID=111781 RepID=UPI00029EEC7F|nr:MFS transporter [[Leptolyngbya] sp. PCC 7376]AFY37594.1 major facilitator superfamily MFS_1 [[Leptolyngbya] sp. PCC 7376]
MARNKVAANIRKLWLLKGLESAWFPIPILMIFYESHGLSLEQGVLLKAILSGAIFLGEIPSGYFADRFGRKTSLVGGACFWLFGWLIYCTQGSFSWFAVAEILVGVGGSLMSGADSAIAYDSLLELSRAGEYRAWEGKASAITGLTEACCGLVGAWIAETNLVYPFYLQTGCIFLYVLLALTLREPTAHRTQETPQWRSLLPSIQAIFTKRPFLRWLLLFSATLSCGTFLIVWLSQEYLVQNGLALAQLGWAWLILHCALAIASGNAAKISPRYYPLVFALLPILLAIAYIALGLIHSLWGILFITAIYVVRGLLSPLVLSYLNDHIPSNLRATLISVNSFLFRLIFFAFAPLLGLVSHLSNFDLSLMFSGIVLGAIAFYAYWQIKPTLNARP